MTNKFSPERGARHRRIARGNDRTEPAGCISPMLRDRFVRQMANVVSAGIARQRHNRLELDALRQELIEIRALMSEAGDGHAARIAVSG